MVLLILAVILSVGLVIYKIYFHTAISIHTELRKGTMWGVVTINKAMPSKIAKLLSRSSESITLTGLESILNMDNDDYVVMRTSFKEGAHTILFSPDKTMRIIPAIIDDAEIKSIIKGHRTKNYPWKTTKIKGTETPYYIQGSNDKIHMPG